jgi:hypothetical protein
MEVNIKASNDANAADIANAERYPGALPLPALTTPLPMSPVPPVYFQGTSHQQLSDDGVTTQPRSFVRGVARLTADTPPEVRWTMVVRYAGEDKWRIEGVQVGGRQSRRGFFGVSVVVVLGAGTLWRGVVAVGHFTVHFCAFFYFLTFFFYFLFRVAFLQRSQLLSIVR